MGQLARRGSGLVGAVRLSLVLRRSPALGWRTRYPRRARAAGHRPSAPSRKTQACQPHQPTPAFFDPVPTGSCNANPRSPHQRDPCKSPLVRGFESAGVGWCGWHACAFEPVHRRAIVSEAEPPAYRALAGRTRDGPESNRPERIDVRVVALVVRDGHPSFGLLPYVLWSA